jgi:hypothetical protein
LDPGLQSSIFNRIHRAAKFDIPKNIDIDQLDRGCQPEEEKESGGLGLDLGVRRIVRRLWFRLFDCSYQFRSFYFDSLADHR